jgi:hypothetical protein
MHHALSKTFYHNGDYLYQEIQHLKKLCILLIECSYILHTVYRIYRNYILKTEINGRGDPLR